ncbi:WASH complex subunit 3 isoform X2 [Carcharodon carcharias]|uniref:WASH complex subunit 3 isoform X2 n=1 Tax=Carcharodon carcharias TaxID=13397 RepID=UPI001B7D90D9|nr:WASH complex subunit 3 isoform X2 [Carcharodon carcharias]
MDADGLPLVGSGIDLTRVPAIQQKRTVAFLNQFIAHTVRFLNRFSTVCEELSSIPGLEDVKVEKTNQDQSFANGPTSVTATKQHQPSPPEVQQNIESTTQSKADSLTENAVTVAKDPRYARYLKMVQVGVPVMAIRNKMISDGLDPDLLETPDAPVPDGVKEDEGDSSGSESSFSD